MTAHERILELAVAALDFPLEHDERRRVDEHLAGCVECRSLVWALRADRQRLGATAVLPAPAGVRQRVLAATLDTGGSPPFLQRPLLVMAAMLMLVALTLAGVAVGSRVLEIFIESPLPVPTAGPVLPSDAATASPALAASQPARTPEPTPTALALDRLGFVRLEFGEGSEQDWRLGIVPTRLVIGTLDGKVTAKIDAGLDGEWEFTMSGTGVSRWATAPAAGRVLWAGGTDLHLVDVDSGEDRIVYRAPEAIDHGALSPDGSSAFVALRDEPDSWSVWRIDLESAAEPEKLRAAPSAGVAATGIVLARTASIFVRVAVAPDGATLAVEECGSLCRIWTMDLSTGAARQYAAAEDAGVWPLLGVIGDVVVDSQAFNLGSGERSDGYCVPALQSDGTPVLVCREEDGSPLQWGGDVIDPRTGASRRAPVEAGREVALVTGQDVGRGYSVVELPAGWILAIEQMPSESEDACNGGYVAWNIDTGDLVPLPALGDTCAP